MGELRPCPSCGSTVPEHGWNCEVGKEQEDVEDQKHRSEFGFGIVICLAKFSEHLQEHGPWSENSIREFAGWTPEKREATLAEAQKYPTGDAAAKVLRMALFEIYDTPEHAISSAIQMWMNAASDHFYDLDDSAPPPLKELAELTLKIGHGFGDEVWTIETIDKIRELWQQSCIALDHMLGIENPDWGEW